MTADKELTFDDPKIAALVEALELKPDEDCLDELAAGEDAAVCFAASESIHGDNCYDADGCEYLVLTDDEADEMADEYIRESLWAFNPSFLVHYLPDGVGIDFVELLQTKCEECNEAIKVMISDIEGLVKDAISSDGRAHFLASYDGNELEAEIDGETYYIYRTN